MMGRNGITTSNINWAFKVHRKETQLLASMGKS